MRQIRGIEPVYVYAEKPEETDDTDYWDDWDDFMEFPENELVPKGNNLDDSDRKNENNYPDEGPIYRINSITTTRILQHDDAIKFFNSLQSNTTHIGWWGAIIGSLKGNPGGPPLGAYMYLKNVEWGHIENKYLNIGKASGIKLVETQVLGSYYPFTVFNIYTGNGEWLYTTTNP